jgi:hypothetical protein
MTKRLVPCGFSVDPVSMAMVGKGKAVPRLAARMPSPEIVAKVGTAWVNTVDPERRHRVVRRNAQSA